MAANGLAFAVGVGVLFLLPSPPPPWLCVPLAVLAVVWIWRSAQLRPLALGLLGFLWAWLHACQLLCAPLPRSLIGQDMMVTGRLASIPAPSSGPSRFLFRVETAQANGSNLDFSGLVRLIWYRDAPELAAGELWRLKVRLKPPHGFANPGGFDYERWLFQQGIKATGYVRSSDQNERLSPGPGVYLIDRWRQSIGEHLRDILQDSPGEPLVSALVLGDRSGLTPRHWEVLTRTGTGHLIAISGLHVGTVAAALFFLVRWAWSRSARLTQMLAAPKAAAMGAFGSAVAYSALAGFALPTQRALVMLAVVLGALLWGRALRPITGMVVALLGVLILDPPAVISPAFWLSFGAVAALLFGLGHRLAGGGLWRKVGKAQWVVALGLLPLLVLLFGQVSLISPIVNLVLVPLFGLLLPAILVASLLGAMLGVELPLFMSAQVLDSGWRVLEWASGWGWAAAAVPSRPGWVAISAVAGAALLLAPRGLPSRWLGVVLLLPLVLTRPAAPRPGEVEFTLLDVGQGLAAVARTSTHTLVYDTGPAFSSGFNAGGAVVLPFLQDAGVGRIDTLILSHGDRDHAGGLAGLLGGIPIDRMLSGEPQAIPASAAPCAAGEGWVWDGVRFDLLHPRRPGLTGNASSCVVRVSTQGASVLLTGDIDAEVERELVRIRGRELRSTLLVAAHHGSATSTSAELLESVAPRFVLYSAGFANRFGFPHAAVRERVGRLSAIELNTANAGAISFRLRSHGLSEPRLYRRTNRRLWAHRAQDPIGSF